MKSAHTRAISRGGTDLLPAQCWCSQDFVHVPPDEVRAGRTFPCKRPACQRIDEAIRASITTTPPSTG